MLCGEKNRLPSDPARAPYRSNANALLPPASVLRSCGPKAGAVSRSAPELDTRPTPGVDVGSAVGMAVAAGVGVSAGRAVGVAGGSAVEVRPGVAATAAVGLGSGVKADPSFRPACPVGSGVSVPAPWLATGGVAVGGATAVSTADAGVAAGPAGSEPQPVAKASSAKTRNGSRAVFFRCLLSTANWACANPTISPLRIA